MSQARRVPLDVRSLGAEGVFLIEASAGTGKTYTITSLVVRLVAERGLRIDQILAVTFTNAATAELRDRIGARLVDAYERLKRDDVPKDDLILQHLAGLKDRALVVQRLALACRDVDCASVFTIHGFAARVLRDFPLESGSRVDAELVGDQRGLLSDVVLDFWLSKVATRSQTEFELMGGHSLMSRLAAVARVAAGSFDVPRVALLRDEDFEQRWTNYLDVHEHCRRAFFEQKDELLSFLQTLVEGQVVKKNMIDTESVGSEIEELSGYFSKGRAELAPPKFDRLTSGKLETALRKGKSAAPHDLMVVLEDFKSARAVVEEAGTALADRLCAELCDEIQLRVGVEHLRLGTQSFDSLLSDLCLALRAPGSGERLARELRARFRVALIDEFQDTDTVQYEIFRRIYIESAAQDWGLYLIGDPKQSIYAFRGADVFTYLKAAELVDDEIYTLSTSYRASPALVTAQNALYGSCYQPFGLDAIVYDEVAPRPGRMNELLGSRGESSEGLRIVYVDDEKCDFVKLAAEEVFALLCEGMQLEGRRVVPSDIAVLTRTNHEAAVLQDLLQSLGVAAVMHGDRSVFEAPEALELHQILGALAQPKKKGALRAALSTRLFGLSLGQIAELDDDVTQLEQWVERFGVYSELWRTRGVARCFETLMNELEALPTILATLGGERRLTNLRHLMELLHEAESTQHLGVFGLLRFLEEAIFDESSHSMAPEARQLRLESDAHAVVLTTAHKSKGLQYNLVVLPVLGRPERQRDALTYRFFDPATERSFIEYRRLQGEPSTKPLHEREELQEGLRLAYVALTRAKHQVLTFVAKGAGYSPLRYLLFSTIWGGGVDPYEFHQRQKELKNCDLYAALAPLVELSDRTISLASPRKLPSPELGPSAPAATLLAPPDLPQIAERESTSSFSAMVRSSHSTFKSRQGRDQADGDVFVISQLDASDPALQQRCVLADFPRGARPGEALHSAFEKSSFDSLHTSERHEVVARELARYGIDEAFIPMARQAIDQVIQVPLPCQVSGVRAPRLQQLESGDLFPEMEFNLPIGSIHKRLSVDSLVDVMADEFPPSYQEALRALSFEAFSGFLRGFIDLVYLHEGRLFALDYKSNFLGESYGAYVPKALQIAMEEHHYLLQAVLYSVALHHFGAFRVPNYDYDRHVGGMHYLFIRGMQPDLGTNGVYAYRPPRSLVEKLCAHLGSSVALRSA